MSIVSSRGPRAALLASAFALILAGSSRAADVTEDQARDVAGQLRAWLTGLVTDRVPLSQDLLTVRPAGASYSVTVPLPAGLLETQDDSGRPTEASVVALIHPEEGTRWRIESMNFPASFRLSPGSAAALDALAAMAGSPGAGARANDSQGLPSAEWRARSQAASGIFDTAQASDSRLDYRMEGITYDARNIGLKSETHTTVDRCNGTTFLHPTLTGGVDFGGEATLEGYTQVSSNPILGSMRVAVRRMFVRGELGSVMTGQVASVIRTTVGFGLDTQAAQGGGDKGLIDRDAGRDVLRRVIATMKGILGGAKLEEIVEGLDVELPLGRGSADKVTYAMGSDAPGGMLRAFSELRLLGLRVIGLPPQFADLVPISVLLRSTVSNINVNALTGLAEDASQDGADPDEMMARLVALFTSGGVRLGFEHLDIDLGFSSMIASGNATVVGPNSARGQADIAITGMDALMARTQKLPNAGQAMAALALAKGFGKAEGDRTVWHIAFSEDNKILVNGMDITRMGGK